MRLTPDDLSIWIPRLTGILVTLFVGMLAADAFGDEKPFFRALPDFLVHLVPALLLLALVVASFRWAWVGGVAFIALAVLYAVTMSKGLVDWMLAISGPLLLAGALFLWSWFQHGRLRAS